MSLIFLCLTLVLKGVVVMTKIKINPPLFFFLATGRFFGRLWTFIACKVRFVPGGLVAKAVPSTFGIMRSPAGLILRFVGRPPDFPQFAWCIPKSETLGNMPEVQHSDVEYLLCASFVAGVRSDPGLERLGGQCFQLVPIFYKAFQMQLEFVGFSFRKFAAA